MLSINMKLELIIIIIAEADIIEGCQAWPSIVFQRHLGIRDENRNSLLYTL